MIDVPAKQAASSTSMTVQVSPSFGGLQIERQKDQAFSSHSNSALASTYNLEYPLSLLDIDKLPVPLTNSFIISSSSFFLMDHHQSFNPFFDANITSFVKGGEDDQYLNPALRADVETIRLGITLYEVDGGYN